MDHDELQDATSDSIRHGTAAPSGPLLDGSARMRSVKRTVETIADTDATVLLLGESGVGKEVVARAIHEASPRAREPFVKVNCAALPAGLLESELFGHEKGAFTGAHRRKLGQFEYAARGTMYLDEIGELPLALQPKLLHVLQDFRFFRVGGHHAVPADARVVAATNRNLELAVRKGEFRDDLYFRLNVVDIHIPPLRQRVEEIPVLAARFLATFTALYQRHAELSPRVMSALMAYPWPGNIREMENVIRRHVLLGESVTIASLSCGREEPAPEPSTPISGLDGLREVARRGAQQAERKALIEILTQVGWNRVAAARALKVSYKTLLNKIAECDLTPPTARKASAPSRPFSVPADSDASSIAH
jgi:two-component system, NtrC family, response regulator AtoC